MTRRNFYSSEHLDRSANKRDDPVWLRERLQHPQTRLIPVWRDRNLVAARSDVEVLTVASSSVESLALVDEPVWLGLHGDVPHFAIDLSHIDDPEAHPSIPQQGRFEDLRRVGPMLAPEAGGLLAYARALVYWHARHQYCGVCGSRTRSESGGHARRCVSQACGAQHFPRTDPATIVLVHDGHDNIVLARSPRFLPGMHSVLAGFVEPGESLEDTVRREVFEEVGLRLGEVRYHSSQPWPFPSSLMIGFTARAQTFDLQPDLAEIEAAAWYSRAMLMASPDDETFRLPRSDSIARRLIQDWLDAG